MYKTWCSIVNLSTMSIPVNIKKITYRINSIYDRIVELFTINVRTSRFLQYSLYWFKLEIVERTRSRSKTVCAPGEHTKNSNDISRVRAYQINSATPLIIMSSLHMHQLVKSMVNWNIYNDNIMTSGVA